MKGSECVISIQELLGLINEFLYSNILHIIDVLIGQRLASSIPGTDISIPINPSTSFSYCLHHSKQYNPEIECARI